MKRTEVELTAELVRALLRDQHPDLADRSLAMGARGWDNQLWRLGDDLVVRLPWQTDEADDLLLKEHAWLPVLAPLLPLPVPVPQRLGQPTERFPHPWVITTWVPGDPADRAPIEKAIEKLKGLKDSTDVAAIKQAVSELDSAAQAMSQHLYKNANTTPGAGPAPDDKKGGDDVIDAEFEVKK